MNKNEIHKQIWISLELIPIGQIFSTTSCQPRKTLSTCPVIVCIVFNYDIIIYTNLNWVYCNVFSLISFSSSLSTESDVWCIFLCFRSPGTSFFFSICQLYLLKIELLLLFSPVSYSPSKLFEKSEYIIEDVISGNLHTTFSSFLNLTFNLAANFFRLQIWLCRDK